MYYVYILQSESTDRYYIGMTISLEKRLKEHNSGKTTSTRRRGPWKVVYSEFHSHRESVWKRERQIKSYKGGEAFKKIIEGEVA